MVKAKDKFDLKMYAIKFEDGSYFRLNTEAEEEKDSFKSTKNLSEATLLNKELKEKMEVVLRNYNHRLYVEEDREFKKVVEIESYGLFKLGK